MKFILTLRDLLIRPRKVYQNNLNYLNPWKFTFSIVGIILFLKYFLYTNVFNKELEEDIYLSDRLAKYLSAESSFFENFEGQITILIVVIWLFTISVLFFEKARTDFKGFLSQLVYTAGVIIFVSEFLGLVNEIFDTSMPDVFGQFIVPITYIVFAYVNYFGNRIPTYLKILAIVVALIPLGDKSTNLVVNLYKRIFHASRIISEGVPISEYDGFTKLFNGNINFGSSVGFADTTSLILYNCEGAPHLDYISERGITSFLALDPTVNWHPVFFTSGDTSIVHAFNQVNGQINFQTYARNYDKRDSMTVDLQLIRGIAQISMNRWIIFGRDSARFPAAIILNNKFEQVERIILNSEDFQNQTFDHVKQVSDSLYAFTSYQIEDDVIHNYQLYYMNLKSKETKGKTEIFERKDKYSVDNFKIIYASDSLLFFGYKIASKLKDKLWIGCVDLTSGKEKWRKEIDIVNDQIIQLSDIIYFNGNLYFSGSAKLVLHRYWLHDHYKYDFLGSVDKLGRVNSLGYLRKKFHETTPSGFYTSKGKLFIIGNSRFVSPIPSFTTDKAFQIDVSKNLNPR